MTRDIVHLAVALLGFLATFYLFRTVPCLPDAKTATHGGGDISVIIPARNEAHNLPGLLSDLKAQTPGPLEVIVADDDSADDTAKVAAAGGAVVLSLRNKPDGWIGKSWACQNAADAAKGGLLLFLDADVRLAPGALHRLLQAYRQSGRPVSVQPYHVTLYAYEQFSLTFNLVVAASVGATRPNSRALGLFGPVLLVPRAQYDQAGGHGGVRGYVVEDMELGLRLAKAGTPGTLFIGDGSLTYRMYPDGPRALFQGWVKNMATGASGTPPLTLLMVILWVGSAFTTVIRLARSAAAGEALWLALYALLFAAWAFTFTRLAARFGHFAKWATLLFPIPMMAFSLIFLVSLVKKILRRPVIWKGRAVGTGGRA